MSEAEVTVEVRNRSGLHARPAASFVRAAGAFVSDLTVTNHGRDDRTASAKSVIGVMGLGVARGHRITIHAAGEDAQAAIAALHALVAAGLGEAIEEP